MTPDRCARYDHALAAGCDVHVSGSSADVQYLTGSEDGNAFVIYQPSSRPTIVVRAAGFNCTVASTQSGDVIPFGLTVRPAEIVADQIRRRRPRRVAVGPLPAAFAEELESRLDGIE